MRCGVAPRKWGRFFVGLRTATAREIYTADAYDNEEISAETAELPSVLGLCKAFGWEMEYVEAIDPFMKARIYGVLDGWARAAKKRSKKNLPPPRPRRRRRR